MAEDITQPILIDVVAALIALAVQQAWERQRGGWPPEPADRQGRLMVA